MEIKALIADSSAKVRKNISRSLKEMGVREIAEATDTDEALELFQQGAYDVVFTEWNTAIGAGEALVKALRKMDAQVPIIVTVPQAKKLPEMQRNCPSATGYLVMPFTTEQLRKTVAEYVPTIAG
jgi:two-component system capsular synthesis sensor histidine kinase RcsC